MTIAWLAFRQRLPGITGGLLVAVIAVVGLVAAFLFWWVMVAFIDSTFHLHMTREQMKVFAAILAVIA